MDRVPYLDLQAQYDSIRTEVLAALGEICESGRFAQGPASSHFEEKFAAYCGIDHCVSLNSPSVWNACRDGSYQADC